LRCGFSPFSSRKDSFGTMTVMKKSMHLLLCFVNPRPRGIFLVHTKKNRPT
jgi:hypothetical protein